MHLFRWYKSLEVSLDPAVVAAQVRKLEPRYRLWLTFSAIIIIFGVVVMAHAEQAEPFRLALGLVLALIGIVGAAATKIQTGVTLSMYRIVLAIHKH